MSAPVDDEIDVGHDPRARAPWHDWSPRRRRIVTVVVAVLVVTAGVLWLVLRPSPAPTPVTPTPPPILQGAPGADVVQQLDPDTGKCPPTATCRYDDTIAAGAEKAFAAAFGSAGFIGRQTVVDAETGEVYWQVIRFSTGTLVTVTLSQQSLTQVAVPPVVVEAPSDVDRKNGAINLTAVRDGYVVTVNAAGLPGQVLPVAAAQKWLRSVPAP